MSPAKQISPKKLSPTYQLLRQSRVFSMPAPLKSGQATRTGIPIHPLRQAVTTPQATRDRGDWGMKRDLPGKRTKVDTLYFHDIDSIDNFTRFNTAESDTTFLKRWQEIDVPLTTFMQWSTTTETAKRASAFDEKGSEGSRSAGSLMGKRWRYGGPDVKSMSAAELAAYINEKIIPRRADFAEFVKKQWNAWSGSEPETNSVWSKENSVEGKLTDAQLAELRNDHTFLIRQVEAFLDLPIDTPMTTHPSAGLYYTRSAAHLPNDAEEGPKSGKRMVPARLVLARTSSGGRGKYVGVGGIVARLTESVTSVEYGEEVEVSISGAVISPEGKLLVDAAINKDDATTHQDGQALNVGTAGLQHWKNLQNYYTEKQAKNEKLKDRLSVFLNQRRFSSE